VLLGMIAGAMVSCTSSEEWVRSQRDKVKVILLEPTDNKGLKLENTKGFTLVMTVTTDPLFYNGDGIPLQRGGSQNLGTKLQINRPGISYEQTSFNVDDCIGKAAKEGVLQSYSSEPPNQSGFYTGQQFQSIERFVVRFTDCLKDSGYSAE